jgi:hypothetical protein
VARQFFVPISTVSPPNLLLSFRPVHSISCLVISLGKIIHRMTRIIRTTLRSLIYGSCPVEPPKTAHAVKTRARSTLMVTLDALTTDRFSVSAKTFN